MATKKAPKKIWNMQLKVGKQKYVLRLTPTDGNAWNAVVEELPTEYGQLPGTFTNRKVAEKMARERIAEYVAKMTKPTKGEVVKNSKAQDKKANERIEKIRIDKVYEIRLKKTANGYSVDIPGFTSGTSANPALTSIEKAKAWARAAISKELDARKDIHQQVAEKMVDEVAKIEDQKATEALPPEPHLDDHVCKEEITETEEQQAKQENAALDGLGVPPTLPKISGTYEVRMWADGHRLGTGRCQLYRGDAKAWPTVGEKYEIQRTDNYPVGHKRFLSSEVTEIVGMEKSVTETTVKFKTRHGHIYKIVVSNTLIDKIKVPQERQETPPPLPPVEESSEESEEPTGEVAKATDSSEEIASTEPEVEVPGESAPKMEGIQKTGLLKRIFGKKASG